MGDFMNNAKSFIRNPLGIIGLFITLIYGAICLVLTSIILQLNLALQIALIAFIIIFPVVILIAFIYLVTKHHRKLYAPRDYQNEEHFMVDHLSAHAKNIKIDNEISETLGCEMKEEHPDTQEQLESVEENRITDIKQSEKEENASIKNQYAVLKKDISTRKDFLLLEEISLRKWERENKMFIQRQVALHFEGNTHFEVDGYGVKNDIRYILDVNIIKECRISASLILKIRRMINFALNEKGYKIVFIIIHEKGFGKYISDKLYKIHNEKSEKFCFVFYSQELLYKEYGIKTIDE